jgi:hypothetical protein
LVAAEGGSSALVAPVGMQQTSGCFGVQASFRLLGVQASEIPCPNCPAGVVRVSFLSAFLTGKCPKTVECGGKHVIMPMPIDDRSGKMRVDG